MHSDQQVTQDAANLPTGHVYQPGDTIGGNYEVQHILGEGGCGVVYLVSQHHPEKVFALKASATSS